jgi:hypothetical protein
VSDPVIDWANGLSVRDLEIIEHEGRYLYPDSLKRRNPKTGELVEVPILVAVPSALERLEGRIEALDFLRRKLKREGALSYEDAVRIVGNDQYEEIEHHHLLSKVLFRREAPHGQYMLPEFLLQVHRGQLVDIYDRIDFYSRVEDPRIKELTEAQFVAILQAIVKTRGLGPLVGIAGGMRDAFVLSMAYQLEGFLTRKPSSQPPATSTPESSTPES